MATRTTRRAFIKQAAAVGAVGPLLFSGKALSQNNRKKLRHAGIGIGGQRGGHDLGQLASHPDIEIVALCDVDARFLEAASKRHPNARLYRDWRVLLEKEADNIDSVNIATTNHMHAPISMSALHMNKHVYCQKPLTHSVFEARKLAEEAAKRPHLITQMGVQTHTAAGYRNAVAKIRAGIAGKVKEVHSWDRVRYHYTGAFTDPPMKKQPATGIDPPEYLDWDLWLGVAPTRPYNDELYHIRMWRRWHDFGGGARGDMAGHMMDVVFDALELTQPEWVLSHRSPPFEDTFSPDNMAVHHFPETPYTDGPLDYIWHDTTTIDTSGWPVEEKDLPGNGSMFICERGFVFLPHGGEARFYPEADFEEPLRRFEQAEGRLDDINHFHQFIDACLGRAQPSTPFGYSGNLTETVLLGNIANRFQKEKLVWNAKELKFDNKPEADKYLRRDYRDGWHVEGLG